MMLERLGDQKLADSAPSDPDIFLSYAHENEARAGLLASALEQRGLAVFWDREVPPGQTWHSHIGEALVNAKCVVVAWSRHSIKSRWVIQEASEGTDRNVLIPVLFEEIQPPFGFRDIQAARLIDWRPDRPSPAFDALLRAVRRIVGGRAGSGVAPAVPDQPRLPRPERVKTIGETISAWPRQTVLATMVGLFAILGAGGATLFWLLTQSGPVTQGPVAEAHLTAKIERPRQQLGGLSEKYETGGRGPGTVSSGIGNSGGVSYGMYQFTSQPRGGTVARFVADEIFPWQGRFTGRSPGTPEFSDVWRALATDEPSAFSAAQHDFVKRTQYDPLVRRIKAEHGIDVDNRSRALQDVIWSVAVQHGPGTAIVHQALTQLQTDGAANPDDPDFDEKLINAIYAERMRDPILSRHSPAVQDAMLKRFRDELRVALVMLKLEEKN